MIGVFEANLFPPGKSSSKRVRVEVEADRIARVYELESGDLIFEFQWRKVKVSARVGNIPRRLVLKDGSVLETRENDVIDGINQKFRRGSFNNYLYRLEKFGRVTIVSFLFLGLFGYWLVQDGVPRMANSIAFSLPDSVLDGTSERTLDFLDRGFFEPSMLPVARRKELSRLFDETVLASRMDVECCELLFRDGGAIGPNAFALPDGTIVMTDQLVDLSSDDRGLIGVMAHEIGHVEERHSMRALLQSSSLALLVILATGDMAELSELALGLPTLFVDAGYSRRFELEADDRAMEIMDKMGHDRKYLADLFEQLDAFCQQETKSSCESGWLSSHPDIDDRVMRLKQTGDVEADVP